MAGSGVYRERRDELRGRRAAIGEAWEPADEELGARAELALELALNLAAAARPAPGLQAAARRVRSAESALERMTANERLSEVLAGLLPEIEAAEKEDPESELARLQDELAAAGNRIALERRRYNQAVQDYNTALQLFPGNVVAWVGGLEREGAYFRTDEASRLGDPPVRFAPQEGATAPAPDKVQ